MRKRWKGWAAITGGDLEVSQPCPNCLRTIEAVTVIALGVEIERDRKTGRVKLAGNATRCGYCNAVLMFTDDKGHLRMMTKEERGNYRPPDPVLEDAIQFARRKVGKCDDFTRKNYN